MLKFLTSKCYANPFILEIKLKQKPYYVIENSVSPTQRLY